MNLKSIWSSNHALLVAGLFMLLTGTYTDNGGFQLAGGILIFVTLVIVVGRANGKKSGN